MGYCLIRPALTLTTALALASCNSEPTGGPGIPEPSALSHSGETAADAVPFDLRGEWGVSRLNGHDLSLRIAFRGSAEVLIWEPECAGQGARYRFVSGKLEFYRPHREGPQEVCDIGYPEDLPAVLDALQGSWDAERQAGGNIVLTRGPDSLTLEKLPVDAPESLEGEWRVAGIDGQSLEGPQGIALSASDDEIWWEPRCAGASVQYRIVNDRFVWIEPAPLYPRPPAAEPEPPPPVCAITVPSHLADAMNAIRAADRIERTGSNGIRLSGTGRSITLFSQ